MMKRLFSALAALALLVSLAACGGPTYRDGTYTATAADYDDSGWRDEVVITVNGGKITDVDWNAYNEEGQDKRTLSMQGHYDMKAGGAKSEWFEQAASMEQALVNEQDPAKLRLRTDGRTDAVSGVSISVSEFVILSAEALQQAK